MASASQAPRPCSFRSGVVRNTGPAHDVDARQNEPTVDNAGFVWIHDELTWAGPGFIHRLPADREAGLHDLRQLGFDVKLLDGTKIATATEFHDEAAAVFGFPDDYGRNWDAFNDCFGDLGIAARTAIIWTEARRLASSDLKTFAEAICMLNDQRQAYSTAAIQIELFVG